MMKAYAKLRSTIIENLGIDYTAAGDLLNVYFAKGTVTDSLAAFFSKYDIELLEYQCVWLVSKLATRLHYTGIPREQFPRIKGVVKRFTVENGLRFCELPGILEAFNKASIPVMLLNGAAMKVFYEPSETRYQNDIDVLVSAENVKKAEALLEKQDFRMQSTFWEQSVYQKNDVRVVVHSSYLRANVLSGVFADIWQNSREISWRGKKVFVPYPEMMLLILLVQGLEACCLRISDCRANHFINVFLDIKYILDSSALRWSRFMDLVQKGRLTLHARLMLDVLNQLYPGLVKKELLEALLFTDREIANVQRLVSYHVSRLQVTDARNRRNRMGYYCNSIAALWNLNCYYGNRSSLFSNIIDFPKFITIWNNKKGIKGLFSKLGGYNK